MFQLFKFSKFIIYVFIILSTSECHWLCSVLFGSDLIGADLQFFSQLRILTVVRTDAFIHTWISCCLINTTMLVYSYKLMDTQSRCQHLSRSRSRSGSYLLNGFPMLPSSPGPCRPPAAGPVASLPGRCFRSGSLSSRVPVVPLSCSAVSELFRFLITGNDRQPNINRRKSGWRTSRHCGPVSGEEAVSWPGGGALRAGEDGAESPLCLELTACTEIRREPLISAEPPQPITAQEHKHVVSPWCVHGPLGASEQRQPKQNRKKLSSAWCLHVKLGRLR